MSSEDGLTRTSHPLLFILGGKTGFCLTLRKELLREAEPQVCASTFYHGRLTQGMHPDISIDTSLRSWDAAEGQAPHVFWGRTHLWTEKKV